MSNPLARDLDHILVHTTGVWKEIDGARIFVTGGTGFIGCWLLESFAWAWERLHLDAGMTVLTRSPEAFQEKAPHLAEHPAIRLLRGDVRNFDYPEGHFTHVIHAAAEANAALNRERPLLLLDTIGDGTRRALDFAVTAGARRFLFTSSGAVYGPQPPEVTHIPESFGGGPDPTRPESVYAEGKRGAELLCSLYDGVYGLECVIARCFAFVGPYLPLNAHFAIGNFISDQVQGGPIRVKGDGTPFRSFLYAADLAIWLWTILVQGRPCRPYNVGSEQAFSIAEIAAAVSASSEPRVGVEISRDPVPGVPASRYVPSTARARDELRLDQWVPLEAAIRRTTAFALQTPLKETWHERPLV